MSQTAYDNFTPEQRSRLTADKTVLPLAIPTIEAIGGGSVRCMLAELFLERSTIQQAQALHQHRRAVRVHE